MKKKVKLSKRKGTGRSARRFDKTRSIQILRSVKGNCLPDKLLTTCRLAHNFTMGFGVLPITGGVGWTVNANDLTAFSSRQSIGAQGFGNVGTNTTIPMGILNLLNVNCYTRFRVYSCKYKVTCQTESIQDCMVLSVAPLASSSNVPAIGSTWMEQARGAKTVFPNAYNARQSSVTINMKTHDIEGVSKVQYETLSQPTSALVSVYGYEGRYNAAVPTLASYYTMLQSSDGLTNAGALNVTCLLEYNVMFYGLNDYTFSQQ